MVEFKTLKPGTVEVSEDGVSKLTLVRETGGSVLAFEGAATVGAESGGDARTSVGTLSAEQVVARLRDLGCSDSEVSTIMSELGS